MSYSPVLSTRAVVSLRRLAWALGLPMTVTMDRVMAVLPVVMEPHKVCQQCQDMGRCKDCVFCDSAVVCVPPTPLKR